MPATAERLLTLDGYLAFEETTEVRHELVNGELREMAGETPLSNEIASNLLVVLKSALKGKPFKVYDHDVKLLIEHLGNVRYPDLVVVRREGVRKKLVTQPILIVEVLSDGTEKEDREDKRKEYLALPTLQFYLLVSQKEMLVEAYIRGERRWEFDFFTQPTDRFELSEAGVSFSVEDLYDEINFTEATNDNKSGG